MSDERKRLAWFHMCFGWWGLLVFVALGLLLETMHGLKIDFYLNVDHETRRLVWRLAHAHGGLISLVHIGFAATIVAVPAAEIGKRMRLASMCLVSSTILLPGGFFAGGLGLHGSDPGIGIFLVPPGGLLLFLSILFVAVGVSRRGPDDTDER